MTTNFDHEPIFWTTTAPGYNTPDRERHRIEDGVEVVERFPQSGHQGDYADRRPAAGLRHVPVIRHDGHTISMVLTNAAAHMDPNTPFGHYQRAKAKFYGWFMPGSCPVALLQTGELQPRHIAEKGLLEPAVQACPPATCNNEHPCMHALAEKKARMQRHNRVEAQKVAAYKDPTERMIEGNRELIEALVTKGKKAP